MQHEAAPGWEHFQHVADIGVRGSGRTLAEAFEQAALAMTAVIVDPAQLAENEMVSVEVRAPDRELLLTEWLNTLIFEMATQHLLFARFTVDIHGDTLSGTAWGERVDVKRHQPTVEIKGATFTELRVWQSDDERWHAQCVVDV